jgi:hypothetical protein
MHTDTHIRGLFFVLCIQSHVARPHAGQILHKLLTPREMLSGSLLEACERPITDRWLPSKCMEIHYFRTNYEFVEAIMTNQWHLQKKMWRCDYNYYFYYHNHFNHHNLCYIIQLGWWNDRATLHAMVTRLSHLWQNFFCEWRHNDD